MATVCPLCEHLKSDDNPFCDEDMAIFQFMQNKARDWWESDHNAKMREAERERRLLALERLIHEEVPTVRSPLYDVREKIRLSIDHLDDSGQVHETGYGMGTADLWITVDGKEYYIRITESHTE